MLRRWAGAAVLMGLLVSGCGTGPGANSAEPESFSPNGVTQADVWAWEEAHLTAIVGCLKTKGYDYTPRQPKHDRSDLLQADGPAHMALDQLKDPQAYVQGIPDNAKGVPAGLPEAYRACDDSLLNQHATRVQAARAAADRIDAYWQEYSTSAPYRDALTAFGTCMRQAGYDAPSPEAAQKFAEDKVAEFLTAHPDPTPAAYEPLVAAEVALKKADVTCWNQTLKQPLSAYTARLMSERGDDVAAARAVYRDGP